MQGRATDRAADGASPFIELARDDWAALAPQAAPTLSEAELVRLMVGRSLTT